MNVLLIGSVTGTAAIHDPIQDVTFVDCEFHYAAKMISELEDLDLVVLANRIGIDRPWIEHCCELIVPALLQHPRRPWILIDDEGLLDLHWSFRPMGIQTYVHELPAVIALRKRDLQLRAA